MSAIGLRQVAAHVVPLSTRRAVKDAHRRWVFRRALRRFVAAPEACSESTSPVLRDLIYGWGNEAWSAGEDFLAACVSHALSVRGPTLECGSGLTTILLGVIAHHRGHCHWALEHLPNWASVTGAFLRNCGVGSVFLDVRPLKDFGDFSWYDLPPTFANGARFSLVVCDGPPGDTKGGRYGLMPMLREKLGEGCLILLDDVERESERIVAKRWSDDLGTVLRVIRCAKSYAEIRVPGEALAAPHLNRPDYVRIRNRMVLARPPLQA